MKNLNRMLDAEHLKPSKIVTHIPGIGGKMKEEPEDFVVEEVAAYELSGEGEHCFMRTRRKGQATRDLVRGVADVLGCTPGEVGYAGLKDRHAVCTQWLSVPAAGASASTVADKLRAEGLTVDGESLHGNKLRIGHLLGNRFDVLLKGVAGDAAVHARAVFDELAPQGFANFYGEQRFGRDGENAQLGLDVLVRKRRMQKWRRQFLLSSLQSALFNAWLHERIAGGSFDVLLPGDIAKKRDTGGLFDATDAEEDVQRFADGLITYTGPMFGSKMREASGAAGDLESRILDESGLTRDGLRAGRLSGTRRPARVVPEDVEIQSEAGGRDLRLRFFLPKGAYATVILNELSC